MRKLRSPSPTRQREKCRNITREVMGSEGFLNQSNIRLGDDSELVGRGSQDADLSAVHMLRLLLFLVVSMPVPESADFAFCFCYSRGW